MLSTRAILKSRESKTGKYWRLNKVQRRMQQEIPMPICFAFSCAASDAIFAASRDNVGSSRVAAMIRNRS